MSNCDICGKEIGLNCYSIGKGRWICPGCSRHLDMSKVGLFERRRLSIEELKAIVLPILKELNDRKAEKQNLIQNFLNLKPIMIGDYFWYSKSMMFSLSLIERL